MPVELDLLNEFWIRCEKRENIFPGYLEQIKKARPFALEDEVARVVSDLAFGPRATHQKIAQYCTSARLPFPVCWIECDTDSAFGKLEGFNYMWGKPTRVGWLLTEFSKGTGGMGDENARPIVGFMAQRIGRTLNKNTGTYLASMYPVCHLFRYEGLFDDNVDQIVSMSSLNFPQEVNDSVDGMNSEPNYRLLAWSPEGPPEYADKSLEELSVLASQSPLYRRAVIGIEHLFGESMIDYGSMERRKRTDDLMLAGIYDQAGELGFLISALALINEVPVRFIPHRPDGRVILKGRTKPFLASNVVQIAVPATRRRVKEIDKHLRSLHDQAQKRRHEVRGHWRHCDKLPTRDPGRWQRGINPFNGKACWKTYVAHHERGSAALGYVDHFYNVAAKQGVRTYLDLPEDKSPQRVDKVLETV